MQIIFALPLALLVLCSQAWAADAIIEPPMVTIPSGTFLMGGDQKPYSPIAPSEQPVHEVSITTFKLSKYEVTVKQFRQFVEDTGHKTSTDCWKLSSNDMGIEMAPGTWNSAAYAPSEFHPVMCVTQEDAKAYALWLSKRTGKKYRLPSEAEWEYAARAGSTTKFHFGDNPAQTCRYGNIYDNTGGPVLSRIGGKKPKETVCDDFAEFTTVVGMYEPNAFGLYDMIGNVSEFVEDCQHQNYDGAPKDGSAWVTNCFRLGGGTMVIRRGGSYSSRPDLPGSEVRSAARAHAGEKNASSTGDGFRIAQDIEYGAGASSGVSPFEVELAKAQQAERQRRAQLAPGKSG